MRAVRRMGAGAWLVVAGVVGLGVYLYTQAKATAAAAAAAAKRKRRSDPARELVSDVGEVASDIYDVVRGAR